MTDAERREQPSIVKRGGPSFPGRRAEASGRAGTWRGIPPRFRPATRRCGDLSRGEPGSPQNKLIKRCSHSDVAGLEQLINA